MFRNSEQFFPFFWFDTDTFWPSEKRLRIPRLQIGRFYHNKTTIFIGLIYDGAWKKLLIPPPQKKSHQFYYWLYRIYLFFQVVKLYNRLYSIFYYCYYCIIIFIYTLVMDILYKKNIGKTTPRNFSGFFILDSWNFFRNRDTPLYPRLPYFGYPYQIVQLRRISGQVPWPYLLDWHTAASPAFLQLPRSSVWWRKHKRS